MFKDPAREVLEYQQVVFDSGVKDGVTPYQGVPTKQSEELWDDLHTRESGFGMTRYTTKR